MHVHMHVSPCELLLVGCAKGGLHPHVMLSGVAAVIHVDACLTALEQAYWLKICSLEQCGVMLQ